MDRKEFSCSPGRQKIYNTPNLMCKNHIWKNSFVIFPRNKDFKYNKNAQFLINRFTSYYKDHLREVKKVDLFNKREFAIARWIGKFIRHQSFSNLKQFYKYILEMSPRHVYYSAAFYDQPSIFKMREKKRQGCDFFIDIDADHFDTPCKHVHDYWICNNCGKMGEGIVTSCPVCTSKKLKIYNWLCKDCLEASKFQIIKLIYNFLIPDFNIDINNCRLAYSGHRGYHLLIKDENIRRLESHERNEIIDYLSGNNISFDILGFKEHKHSIYGFKINNYGWEGKIANRLENILQQYSTLELKNFLKKCKLNSDLVQSFLSSKNSLYRAIHNGKSIWTIEGFNLQDWYLILNKIIDDIGVKVDRPVSIDTARLTRYPNTIHGKSGFKVQELTIDQLVDFNPLNESNVHLDPIIFYNKNRHYKLRIINDHVSKINLKDESYGKYYHNEIIEVPEHVAIFLLCKEVAELY